MTRLAIVAIFALLPVGASAFDRYAALAETAHQLSDLSKALNLVISTATPNL
jgi:hypothetical protein